MKKILFIVLALFTFVARADNENVITSKKYVDDEMAKLQPQFDGLGNDKLMLYSSTTDGEVTSRDIVTSLGTSTTANTVPTRGAIVAGLNTKQDTLNGPAGWVVENTGIAGHVGAKPIYSSTDNYKTALVTAGDLNQIVIDAVNSELTTLPGIGWRINTSVTLPTLRDLYLPDGYTQLEYIESTGTQYIDTDYLPNNLTNFEIQYNHTSWNTSNIANCPYGTTTIPTPSSAFYGLFRTVPGASNFNRIAWGDNSDHSNIEIEPVSVNLNTWYTDKYLQNQMYINNNLVATSSTLPTIQWSAPNTLWLFARNGDSEVKKMYSNVKISYAKAWESGGYIFNLIPARRDSDGEVGMYDLVSSTFFTNSGTGEFIAGPVQSN